VVVVSPFLPGILDIRWDTPTALAKNAKFNILGVNIYRSESSDRGPFHRINEFPVQGTMFRDRLDYAEIREVVDWSTGWVHKGDAPNNRRWVIRTRGTIVKRYHHLPGDGPQWANAPKDVELYIDGVEVPVDSVFGRSGEITLINQPDWEVVTETETNASIPNAASSVEVVYYTPKNFVVSGLDRYLHYRLTTVANVDGYLVETPFGYSQPTSNHEIEKLDYIWREGVRRNAWILQQGGERVKLFTRKVCGVPCDCGLDPRQRDYLGQPKKNCPTCYGTSYVGGFDGPFDAIIAPDDAERRITQLAGGRVKQHSYEVWMGPSPLLTQRDFVVKQTNERYSIGPVRRPTNRGNILQQHFTIGYIDEADIRYSVPIDGTSDLVYPESRPSFIDMPRMPIDGGPSREEVEGWQDPQGPFPSGELNTTPMGTEKANVPDADEPRGRTKAWENITW
jgi:hypothetical protein